jgi:hypothetical protein
MLCRRRRHYLRRDDDIILYRAPAFGSKASDGQIFAPVYARERERERERKKKERADYFLVEIKSTYRGTMKEAKERAAS